MHIATIAQIQHRPDQLGWTHPNIPGRTLVRDFAGKFWLESPDGSRELVSGGPAAGLVMSNKDGWAEVPAL